MPGVAGGAPPPGARPRVAGGAPPPGARPRVAVVNANVFNTSPCRAAVAAFQDDPTNEIARHLHGRCGQAGDPGPKGRPGSPRSTRHVDVTCDVAPDGRTTTPVEPALGYGPWPRCSTARSARCSSGARSNSRRSKIPSLPPTQPT